MGHPNDLGGRTIAQGTRDLARKKGLEVLAVEAFPPASSDFSAILNKVRAANPDVLGAVPGSPEASVAIVRKAQATEREPADVRVRQNRLEHILRCPRA